MPSRIPQPDPLAAEVERLREQLLDLGQAVTVPEVAR